MQRRKPGSKKSSPRTTQESDQSIRRFIQESGDDKSSPWDIDESVIESLTLEDLLHLPIYREGRNASGSGDKVMFQVRISSSLMRALARGYERSRFTFGTSKKPFDLWPDYQRHAIFTAALLMNMRFSEELGPEDIISLSEQEDLFSLETVPELIDRLKKSLRLRTASKQRVLFGKFMSRISNDTQSHYEVYISALRRDGFFEELLEDWKNWQKAVGDTETRDETEEGPDMQEDV